MSQSYVYLMQRNLSLYPIWSGLLNVSFRLPVFFLFLMKYCTLSQVLQLEALYYICVVILEVPSGWISDRFGRVIALRLSAIGLFVSYLFFCFGESFEWFIVAQISMALGFSFNSGSDTAFHLDSLESLEKQKEYSYRESRVSGIGFFIGGITALFGGFIGVFNLKLPYIAALLSAFLMVVISFFMSEPTSHKKAPHFFKQLRFCILKACSPFLGVLFLYVILMTILNHIPYEFIQPFIKESLIPFGISESWIPLVAGLHAALALLIAAFFGYKSHGIVKKIGLFCTLSLAGSLQILIIGIMGWFAPMSFFPVFLLVILTLFRSVPRGLMTAPLNVAIAPRVGVAQRATYLSMQSLAGRLSFSFVLFLMASITSANGWEEVAVNIKYSFYIGFFGLSFFIALVFFFKYVGKKNFS